MNDAVIPYVRIDQIKKFIVEMPKETCTIEELSNKFGRSNVANALPTLQLLRLIKYDKKNGQISLTDRGLNFRVAMITEDYEKAREILKKVVDELEIFTFIRGLLDRRGALTAQEIGKELSFRYNKIWRNPRTYATYGAACASILGFVGYGIYERGTLRKGQAKITKETKLPSPYPSFKKIIKIAEEIGNDVVDLHVLSDRLNTSINRLGAELSVCVELGIVQRLAPGKFTLTKKGKDIIDPLNNNRKTEIWRMILLESRYSKIINLLKNKNFDLQELGNILKHHLGGHWKEEKTIYTYTKKFLNWLNEAELVKKVNGKYKIIAENATLPIKDRGKSSLPGMGLEEYYIMGKYIGIISSSKNHNEISKAVEGLIEICKRENNLEDIIEIIEEHLNLFNDVKLEDGRIFIPDIKLLERRLKLGGGEIAKI